MTDVRTVLAPDCTMWLHSLLDDSVRHRSRFPSVVHEAEPLTHPEGKPAAISQGLSSFCRSHNLVWLKLLGRREDSWLLEWGTATHMPCENCEPKKNEAQQKAPDISMLTFRNYMTCQSKCVPMDIRNSNSSRAMETPFCICAGRAQMYGCMHLHADACRCVQTCPVSSSWTLCRCICFADA
jgi:hypothetical protein